MANEPYSPVPAVSPSAPAGQFENVQASPADFPGGQVGPALQHAGAADEQFGNVLGENAIRLQDLTNQADARVALQNYTPDISQAYAKYAELTGKASHDAFPGFLKQINDIQNQHAAALNSPMAKEEFLRASAYLGNHLSTMASVRAAQQLKAYHEGARLGAVETNASIAAFMANSSSVVDATIASTNQIADGLIRDRNIDVNDPEGKITADDLRRKTVGPVVFAAINTLAHQNPAAAEALVNKYHDVMDRVSMERAQNLLKDTANNAALDKFEQDHAPGGAGGGAIVPSVPYQPGTLPKTMGISPTQYDSFKESVAGIEQARYDQMGGSSNKFAGRYQMGPTEIAETARRLFEKPPTQDQFLHDPQMQERYFEAYTAAHDQQLMRDSPQYRAMNPGERLAVLGYAHNQGAGGATEWLKGNPAGRDAFGTSGKDYYDAVLRNGGSAAGGTVTGNNASLTGTAEGDMALATPPLTNAAYTPTSGESPGAMTPGAMPSSPLHNPNAYGEFAKQYQQAVEDAKAAFPNNPRMQKEASDRVWTQIQRIVALQAHTDATIKAAQHENAEAAASDLVDAMIKNPRAVDPNKMIADNPKLVGQGDVKKALFDFYIQKSLQAGEEPFGHSPAYTTAYRNIVSNPGTPDHISSRADLLRMATDNGGQLTTHEVDKLGAYMNEMRQNKDVWATHNAAAGMAAYAKTQLLFKDADTSDTPMLGALKDTQGLQIYNGTFVPQFFAGLDKAMEDEAAGTKGVVSKYLSKDNIDTMVRGMRSDHDKNVARLKALGEDSTTAPEKEGTPLPEVPNGLNKDAWNTLITNVPNNDKGQPWNHHAWGQLLEVLMQNKDDPDVQAAFNKRFALYGLDAKDVTNQLSGAKPVSGTTPTGAPIGAPQTPERHYQPREPVHTTRPAAPTGHDYTGAFRGAVEQFGQEGANVSGAPVEGAELPTIPEIDTTRTPNPARRQHFRETHP